MNSLFIALGAAILYLAAYHTYGKYLGRKIFKLNSEAVCPSKEFEDNMDFVPTKKPILFGHHYTSIAGAGPIVGPANMIETIGIPKQVAFTIMGVFAASFAATTMDTATRLQRYVVAELGNAIGISAVAKKHPATFVAVVPEAEMEVS